MKRRRNHCRFINRKDSLRLLRDICIKIGIHELIILIKWNIYYSFILFLFLFVILIVIFSISLIYLLDCKS